MVWYPQGRLSVLTGDTGSNGVDLTADTVNVALMDTTYTYATAHDFWDDLAAANGEVGLASPPTSYTVGGEALASKTFAITATTTARLDAADLLFSAIGNGTNATFDAIVVYMDSGVDATSPLLGHAAVASTTTDGGNITLVWNAAGILQITA